MHKGLLHLRYFHVCSLTHKSKEICYFRCLGFFNGARKFSSEESFYLYFLVDLGTLVPRSSTGVLVCVAEHWEAGFAGWIYFQVSVHFCNTNDTNTCLGRRPQPRHPALETRLECQISFGNCRGSLRAEGCATSSGIPAFPSLTCKGESSLCSPVSALIFLRSSDSEEAFETPESTTPVKAPPSPPQPPPEAAAAAAVVADVAEQEIKPQLPVEDTGNEWDTLLREVNMQGAVSLSTGKELMLINWLLEY